MIKFFGPSVDRGMRIHNTSLIDVIGQPRQPRLPCSEHEISEVEERRARSDAFVGRSRQEPQHGIDMEGEGEQKGLLDLSIGSRAKS